MKIIYFYLSVAIVFFFLIDIHSVHCRPTTVGKLSRMRVMRLESNLDSWGPLTTINVQTNILSNIVAGKGTDSK